MDEVTQKLSRTIWVGVGLVIVILCVSYVLSQFEGKRARTQATAAPVISQVTDFTLTNQLGQAVSLADLRGKVWVADIIFTSCAGPCPDMTKHMRLLQDALPATSSAKLVTLTTDPETDTPAVMKKYSETYGAKSDRWFFLTGTKKEIVGLAAHGLKLAAVEKKPEERVDANDLFIHTTVFVVVDKQARLRGVFETAGEGIDFAKSQAEMLALIQKLEREP